MIVILTRWGKLTRRKSPIVKRCRGLSKLNLMHNCYSLTSLEIVVDLLAKCVNLVSRMGDEERKNHLHHGAETAPIDTSLVVCDTH